MKEIRVVTQAMPNGKIESFIEVVVEPIETPMDHITKRIMDTREKQTRAALIQLGWTPPGTLNAFEIAALEWMKACSCASTTAPEACAACTHAFLEHVKSLVNSR